MFSLPADHQRADIAQVDPKVLPAAELRARARKLQERCPGARARAPRQKGAQPDRPICQHQLDGVALACARKQKQARQRQSQTPRVSKVTTFSYGTDVPASLLRRFLDLFEKRYREKQLAKIKFFMYRRLHVRSIMY